MGMLIFLCYMGGWQVHMCECGDQECLPQSFSLFLFFFFKERISHWTWNLLVILCPSPLPSPALRLSAHSASPSFYWVLQIWTQVLLFTISPVWTEPPPQSCAGFFLIVLCSTFSLNINFPLPLDTRIGVGIYLCIAAIGLQDPL